MHVPNHILRMMGAIVKEANIPDQYEQSMNINIVRPAFPPVVVVDNRALWPCRLLCVKAAGCVESQRRGGVRDRRSSRTSWARASAF